MSGRVDGPTILARAARAHSRRVARPRAPDHRPLVRRVVTAGRPGDHRQRPRHPVFHRRPGVAALARAAGGDAGLVEPRPAAARLVAAAGGGRIRHSRGGARPATGWRGIFRAEDGRESPTAVVVDPAVARSSRSPHRLDRRSSRRRLAAVRWCLQTDVFVVTFDGDKRQVEGQLGEPVRARASIPPGSRSSVRGAARRRRRRRRRGAVGLGVDRVVRPASVTTLMTA